MSVRTQLALALSVVALTLVTGCSREQAAETVETVNPSAGPAARPAIVIDSGTLVDIGGGRVAAVYGQEDSICGGPISFTECKVVKVEPGLHQVTLVAKNEQQQDIHWDEPWEISKNGNRYRIKRPDGTVVSAARANNK